MKNMLKDAVRNTVLMCTSFKSECVAPVLNRESDVDNCILIHGPVDADMYVSAIKLCRYYLKSAYIVVSTWDYTDLKWIEMIKKYVNKVILNEWPSYEGCQHRNCQIKAINAGLDFILSIQQTSDVNRGVTIKLRSDCILINRDIFTKIRLDLKEFPVDEKYQQIGRLVIIQPRKFIPYRINDFLMGGYTEDIKEFWNIRYSEESLERKQRDSIYYSIKNMCAAEEFFFISFAKKINRSMLYTIEDGWLFLKELFCVWDISDFGVIWLKNPVWNLMSIENWYGKLKGIPDLIYIDRKTWKKMYEGSYSTYKQNYNLKDMYYSHKLKKTNERLR